jgi:hypothetical protein
MKVVMVICDKSEIRSTKLEMVRYFDKLSIDRLTILSEAEGEIQNPNPGMPGQIQNKLDFRPVLSPGQAFRGNDKTCTATLFSHKQR